MNYVREVIGERDPFRPSNRPANTLQDPFPKSGFSGLESAGIGRSDSFDSHFRAPRTRASVVSVVLKPQKVEKPHLPPCLIRL